MKRILFFIISITSLFGDPLLEGDKMYRAGEASDTFDERRAYFNQALAAYLSLEGEVEAQSSGLFQLNLGKIYDQLGEYPLAYHAFLEAKRLRPRDPRVLRALNRTRELLGLPLEDAEPWDQKILLLSFFSTAEKLRFWVFLTIFFFFYFSWRLWSETKSSFLWVSPLCILWGYLFLGFVSLLFFTSQEGVVVEGTLIRRDGGEIYALVQDNPLPVGEKVKVLESVNEDWIKVIIEDGTLGFIPKNKVRLLQSP